MKAILAILVLLVSTFYSPVALSAPTAHLHPNAKMSLAPQPKRAERDSMERKIGMGLFVGEPTGFSVEYYQRERRSIASALAYSFDQYVVLFSDYLLHYPGAFGKSSRFFRSFGPYIGLGGIAFFSTSSEKANSDIYSYLFDRSVFGGVGARIPFGLEWVSSNPNIGLFFELVPGIGVIPELFSFFQGGVGVRAYF